MCNLINQQEDRNGLQREKTCLRGFANNTGADQPVHLHTHTVFHGHGNYAERTNCFIYGQTVEIRTRQYFTMHVPKILKMNMYILKVSKGAKIRNRYNQEPHLTQDTNGKVTNSQLDTTNESKEVSPFPADDHKTHINIHAQRHSKRKTEKTHKRSTKKYRLGEVSKIFYWRP